MSKISEYEFSFGELIESIKGALHWIEDVSHPVNAQQAKELNQMLVTALKTAKTLQKTTLQKLTKQRAAAAQKRLAGPYRTPSEDKLLNIMLDDYSIYDPNMMERSLGLSNLIKLGFVRKDDKRGIGNARAALKWFERNATTRY